MTSTFNNVEYLLVGSIEKTNVEKLKDLILILTDQKDHFYFEEKVTVYKIDKQNLNLSVYLFEPNDDSLKPYKISYIAKPDSINHKSFHVTLRNRVDIISSDKTIVFFNEIGFKKDYEFICKGWMYSKMNIKVKIIQLYKKLNDNDNIVSYEPICDSYLVEMSLISTTSTNSEEHAKQLLQFSQKLIPFVSLVKIDHSWL